MQRRLNRISRDEILDLGDYERKRDEIRPRAITARALRRIELGPNATVAFENRETVIYQIQEMLRAERIAKEPEVEHEIETYSDLLPSPDELSATLMFEFSESDGRALRLRDLVGFEDHLRLDLGDAGTATAYFDRRQIDADKMSAVQFIRFSLDARQRSALARGRVTLVADHEQYSFEAPLSAAVCHALTADLEAAAGEE